MGDKEGKWREHLKAGEAAALTLNGYAKSNRINVQGLYEARRLRAQRAGVGWAVVRVTPTRPSRLVWRPGNARHRPPFLYRRDWATAFS